MTFPIRSARTAILAVVLPTAAVAADPPAPEPSAPPRNASATATEGGSVFVPAAASLTAASVMLAEGETGPATQAAQRRAVEEMARLIEAIRNAPSPGGQDEGKPSDPADEGAAPSKRPSTGTPVGGTGGADAAAAGREGKADESSDRRDAAPARSAVVPYRDSLIEGTWGHLPPRLRERLLNGGGDRVLPKYDPLVRRYFESLAEPDGPR